MALQAGTAKRKAPLPTAKQAKVPVIKPQDLGVKVLAEWEDSDDVVADIVAIHGFGADPKTAWTHESGSKKVNWLADKDMLPTACPRTRILSFNYDSVPVGDNPARQSIPNIAMKLLSGIAAKRRGCQLRPIVFIGHCLGGVIAEKAYTIARVHASDYPHIYDSVTGMLTLGTPHEGLSIDKGLQQMFEQTAPWGMRMENSLIGVLHRDNDFLVSIVHDFTREINTRKHPPQICCFFEERAARFGSIAGVETELEFIVGESSGTLNGHQKAGLCLSHFDMDKFEDSKDSHYQSVSEKISDMVNKSREILEGRGVGISLSKPAPQQQQYAQLAGHPFREEPNFVARGEILQRIERTFDKTGLAVLCGGAGIGKTHVAIKYAHEFGRKFPGSKLHWVNAQSAEQFELSYRFIASALNLGDVGKDVVGLVHRHLRQDCGSRWLMVLDGLRDDAHLTATSGSDKGRSLLEFVPKCHSGRVLATTRFRAVANRLVGQQDSHTIEVPTLEDGEAAQLLTGSPAVGDAARLRSAARVAKELGHSPVALTLASTYLHAVKKMPLSRYLEVIASQQPTDPRGTKEEVGVRRAWRPLFDDLSKRHPETARFMLLIGVLDVQTLLTSFVAEAAVDRDVDKHIDILVRYGLLEPFVNRTAICVTAMVRQSVCEWLVEHDQKLVYEEKALSLMSTAYPASEEEHDRCGVLHPYAVAILQFPPPTAAEAKRDRAKLLFKVARYLLRLEQHQLAIQHLQGCLRLGAEDPKRVQSMIEEAQTAMSRSAPAAGGGGVEGHRQISLAWSRGVVAPAAVASLFRAGPNDIRVEPGRGWAENYSLALRLAKQNLFREAESHYVAALQAAARLFGLDDYVTLQILGSLAIARCSLGYADEAKTALEFVLARQRNILGPHHPEALVTQYNLALVLQMTDQLEAAGVELQHVLDMRIQLLGHGDSATVQALEQLIRNCQARGMPESAETLRRVALQHREESTALAYR